MAKNKKHLPYHDAHIDKAIFYPYCNPPRWRAPNKQKFRHGSNVTQNEWYDPKPLPINKYLAATNDEVTCTACIKSMLNGNQRCDICGEMLYGHQTHCDECLKKEPLSVALAEVSVLSDELLNICALCNTHGHSDVEIDDFMDVPLCKQCQMLAADMVVANGASALYRDAILEYRSIAKKLGSIETRYEKKLSKQREALQAKLKPLVKGSK